MAKTGAHKQAVLTAEMLRDALTYDAETGVFTWKNHSGSKMKQGDVAGSISHKKGYRIIRVHYHRYLAHRLAWLYVYGEWPAGEIDHINGNTGDNSIGNLRTVTRQQNCWNKTAPTQGKSGLRHIRLKGKKFQVMFARGVERIYHKSFPTLEAALKARDEVALRLRGGFAPSHDA